MSLFASGLALILLGVVAAWLLRRHPAGDRIAAALIGAGCAAGVLLGVLVLVTGNSASIALHSTVPGGDWQVGVDALSAFFLIMVSAVGAASVVFGVPYMAPERGHRPVWAVHATVGVLVAAMWLVVTAQSIVVFLGAWEAMAMASYFLIVVEYEKPESRRAGLIYLVATHTGTLALFAMFAVWGSAADDWTFRALAAAASGLGSSAFLVLLAALFGFGVKAGLVPFHFWLPPAHAAAPTHVSALLSGVVIKTGIYGLLRVVSMLGTPPAWWGWLVLLIGIASAVLGVLWALAQHDLKRLLAYHSVENIGIILMGMGIGALGAAHDRPVIAVIGYAAALLHTLNHALFKSLLFMGAGVVYRATGTRSMEQLGGLARRLPVTWLAFLVGATAIIGVPPLNGFVSEWMVYQGIFRAGQTADALRLASLGAPALALVGALALACFAKAAGVVFLGHARTAAAEGAREPKAETLTPMLALAAACLLLGLFAPYGMAPALEVGARVAGAPGAVARDAFQLLDGATWIGAVGAGLLAAAAALWFGRARLLRRRSVRHAETWGCAYGAASPRMQYTASSFAAPLLSAFGGWSGVHAERTATSFATHPVDLVLDRFVAPVWRRIQRWALILRPIQQGRLHVYLLYVMAALLALLGYVAIAGRV